MREKQQIISIFQQNNHLAFREKPLECWKFIKPSPEDIIIQYGSKVGSEEVNPFLNGFWIHFISKNFYDVFTVNVPIDHATQNWLMAFKEKHSCSFDMDNIIHWDSLNSIEYEYLVQDGRILDSYSDAKCCQNGIVLSLCESGYNVYLVQGELLRKTL